MRFGKDALLDLSKAVFKGASAHFTKLLEEDKKYLGLKEIKACHTIFECPAIFDLKIQSCPDFSKTHFTKYYSIEETWLEEGEEISEINKEDIEKFRFFKNYFKEKGNHFKENEYFSYEMKAVEKRKKHDLEHPQLTQKEPQKNKGFFNFRRWKQRLALKRWKLRCARLCSFKEWANLWLFRFYKNHSDYGMSISEPIKKILGSIILFSFAFWIFFPQEFTKKPDEKSLAFNSVNSTYSIEQKSVAKPREISISIESQNIFSNAKTEQNNQIYETSFGQIAAKNFLLTINPLNSFKAVENSSSAFFIFLVGFQAILNTTLLFLLALGIRNRFKLK